MGDVRQRTTLGNRFRFLVRFLGLTGLLAAAVGAVLLSTVLPVPDGWTVESLRAAFDGATGSFAQQATFVLAAGLIAVVVWLLVELLSTLFLVTGRRTVVGTNTYLQIGLAAVLFVVVNVWSFSHYARFDLTRDKQFTLPESVVTRLKALDPASPTDVVVLQLHKTAGSLSDKPDALDFAAERKVVEKVRDLVDQLRELGPRFRVTVLDVEEEGYESRLAALTKDAPELRSAIEAAPENSIFFRGGKNVQRMSFSEFYLLDKAASQTTADGKKQVTNLVLVPQGIESFARKVEEVAEKRPKVGLLVIHPELSTREASDDYSAAGLRKSLEANGFEVVDVLVKQWTGRGGPQPAAFTYEEYDFDRLERTYNYLSSQLAGWENNVKLLGEVARKVKTAPLSQVDRQFRSLVGGPITDEADRQRVLQILQLNVERSKEAVAAIGDELKEVAPKYRELAKNDKAVEGRRVSDLKAKLAQAVADCDVLIVPRLTTVDVAKGFVIRPSFYTLPADHADAIKEFLKAGKPVLACFGPSSFGSPGLDAPPDDVEKLFNRLGIEFGNQTILTDKEGRAAAERQGEALGSAVDLPAFVFESPAKDKRPNPIAAAFQLTARAVGGKLELKRSGPRAVSVSPSVAARQPFAAEILATVKESWNEARPLADDDYLPKYEQPKPDDPTRGTKDEERRGPFPVGVAIETKVPAEWYDPRLAAVKAAAAVAGAAAEVAPGLAAAALDPAAFAPALPADQRPHPPTVRVVAYGHGGLFTGKRLDPAQEKLLLHTLNWELKRADRLPQDRPDAETWKYPRVALSSRDSFLWHMGTFLGLPLLCGYFGLLVLMTRKVR